MLLLWRIVRNPRIPSDSLGNLVESFATSKGRVIFNIKLPNMRICTQHKHLTCLPRADQDSGLMAKKCDGALARSPFGIKTKARPTEVQQGAGGLQGEPFLQRTLGDGGQESIL